MLTRDISLSPTVMCVCPHSLCSHANKTARRLVCGYKPGWCLQALIREHEGDARWGQHAQAIVHGGMWKSPGNGGHDDKVIC